jgi:RHH-type proline utilization regulon transcriptional repressor/proline dehydrogenase/delta 1-pyrroline-5-carboxylate dehydrogenase
VQPAAAPAARLPSPNEPEAEARQRLLAEAAHLRFDRAAAAAEAREWTLAVRSMRGSLSHADAMLDAFGLATPEGGALMRLSEALLRTPDRDSAWRLICENLTDAQWRAPASARISVRAATTLLRWTARALRSREKRLAFLSAPIVSAVRYGVASVAEHFIVSTNVQAALARMARESALRLCSIDCLGESARTQAQADAYLRAYDDAIDQLARQPEAPIHERHGVSVKLSALEPRFGPRHRSEYGERLIPRMRRLAHRAAIGGVALTIDAEEQDRLESTLDIAEALMSDPATRDWEGLGLVVQAYGLRALHMIDWIASTARRCERRVAVRLVKGAYWDTEIKRAQERGLDAYPVYTDKGAVDVSYLVAAQRLFRHSDVIYPQFATHNAMTIASVRAMAPVGAVFEFQRLHGMGEQLYAVAARKPGFPQVRTYAPVGSHEDLLAYLIRRLLENGANSSFVRWFLDPRIPVESLIVDPVAALQRS